MCIQNAIRRYIAKATSFTRRMIHKIIATVKVSQQRTATTNSEKSV